MLGGMRSLFHFAFNVTDLDQARRALEAATLRVFRWCATSPVSDRAHEPLAALRAYLRCIALGLSPRVALRSAGVALIHDRHEPLAGDMASPVKPMLADVLRIVHTDAVCTGDVADVLGRKVTAMGPIPRIRSWQRG